jgi:hypothetical protein
MAGHCRYAPIRGTAISNATANPISLTPSPDMRINTPTVTLAPTLTEAPTVPPSPTPEQLGGTEAAYIFEHGSYNISIPKDISNILASPSSPEFWKQPTGIFHTDGTPVVWGEVFFIKLPTGLIRMEIPVIVRGVIEIPNPKPEIGGTLIFPVFEAPARGGSDFLVPLLQVNRYSTQPVTNIEYLNDGIPIDWASSFDHPMDWSAFSQGATFTGIGNGRDIAELLKP